MTKPIKRHESIQPLSRDHSHALLLSWKIRSGISKGVDINRIKKYADWFYTNHIKPHFGIEEKYVFPILGSENHLAQKALNQHQNIKELFLATDHLEVNLRMLEQKLTEHIRFEERELFTEIEKVASKNQLEQIKEVHPDLKFEENSDDEFWK